jgi:hypothetical protein
MTKSFIKEAAEVIGVDPAELTSVEAYQILQKFVINESDVKIIKSKKPADKKKD